MPDISKALFGGEVDTPHFTKGTLVKSKGQRLRCEARCSYSSRRMWFCYGSKLLNLKGLAVDILFVNFSYTI